MIPKPLKTGLLSLLCATTLFATTANAQETYRGPTAGVAGLGTDMWTQAMSGLRLFTPHRDDCVTATEVFVKVYTNTNSLDFGFCIDKDEHTSGAKELEDARIECLEDGKRLPEPAEWKYACQSIAGVNNMTDDWEWVSNFVEFDTSSSHAAGVGSPIAGGSGCKSMSQHWLGRSTGLSHSNIFRCVR